MPMHGQRKSPRQLWRHWLPSTRFARPSLSRRQNLLTEPLEQRSMLTTWWPALDDAITHQRIAAIKHTGTHDPIFQTMAEVVNVQPQANESIPLIGVTAARQTAAFAGIDGSGFSTVIIDTGIDLDHPFFGQDSDSNGVSDRIVFSYDFSGLNDPDASDFDGHGTNVAGIATSSSPFFGGVAPGSDVIVLKVFSDFGFGASPFDIEEALQWVVQNAATYNIASVNMSLGIPFSNDTFPVVDFFYGDEFAALKAMDVAVVVAAGNDYQFFQSPGIGSPASDPNAIAVSATYDSDVGRLFSDFTTAADRITSFSQRHPSLTTVFAPGALITSAGLNGSLLTQAGTSQAAPHVAGLITLAQQLAVQETGGRLPVDELIALLQATGVTIFDGDDEDTAVSPTRASYQRIDAFSLLQAIAGQSVQPPPAEIHGNVFEDVNGDGVQDPTEAGLPGWTVYLDVNNSKQPDSFTTASASTRTLQIRDLQTTTSFLSVKNSLFTPSDVNVTLNISHAKPSDLDIFLIGPTGTRVRLFSGVAPPGGGGGGGFFGGFFNTTFDDEATTSITAGQSPYIGSFQPSQLLSAFDNLEANGLWKLEITDKNGGTSGTLNGWSLDFTFDEPVHTTLADDPLTVGADEDGQYTFTGLRSSVYAVSVVPPPGSDFKQIAPLGSQVAITELEIRSPDKFELQNVSKQTVDTRDWFVAVSNAPYGSINDANPTVWKLPYVDFSTLTDGSNNGGEVQRFELKNFDDGTFGLRLGNEQTGALSVLAVASDVRAALEGLPSIGPGNVQVTGTGRAGDPFVATFSASLGNLPQIVAGLGPDGILYRTDTLSDNYFGANIFWNGTNGRIGTGWVMIVDGQGQIVDWVGWGWDQAQLDSFDVTVNGVHIGGLDNEWVGATLPRAASMSLQRVGNNDISFASDFAATAAGSVGTKNQGIVTDFLYAGAPRPQYVAVNPADVILNVNFSALDVNAQTSGSSGDPVGGDPGDGGTGGDAGGDPGGGNPGSGDTPDDTDEPVDTDDPLIIPGFSPIPGVSVGLYRPQNGNFYLRDSNTTGVANSVFAIDENLQNVIAVIGDWNGDGVSSSGLYDPSNGKFYLRDDNTIGFADHTFQFGPGGNMGWQPIVGDWNNDGVDTVGLYDPTRGVVFLNNDHEAGPAEQVFFYGPAGAGWLAVAGDWNNDGQTTVGLYNPNTGGFFLRNAHAAGPADKVFSFGPGGAGWKPVVGDWNQDGVDTVGMFNDNAGAFHLRNDNASGPADVSFFYGPAGQGWTPLAGNWHGIGTGLRLTGASTIDANPNLLTEAGLASMKTAAAARWAAVGASQAQVQAMADATVVSADLPGNYLAWYENGIVYVDNNAAGRGWFIDPVPTTNSEYRLNAGRLRAVDETLASGDVDLLSVMIHELGVVIGEEIEHGSHSAMDDSLSVSERRLP